MCLSLSVSLSRCNGIWWVESTQCPWPCVSPISCNTSTMDQVPDGWLFEHWPEMDSYWGLTPITCADAMSGFPHVASSQWTSLGGTLSLLLQALTLALRSPRDLAGPSLYHIATQPSFPFTWGNSCSEVQWFSQYYLTSSLFPLMRIPFRAGIVQHVKPLLAMPVSLINLLIGVLAVLLPIHLLANPPEKTEYDMWSPGVHPHGRCGGVTDFWPWPGPTLAIATI